jgi:hypothetical protein
MQRKYYKEIVKSGEENDFLKKIIDKIDITKEMLDGLEELTFVVNDKTTGEKVEIYIPQKDLLECF